METDLNSLLAFVRSHEGMEDARIDEDLGKWSVWCSVREHFQDELTNEWKSYLAYTRLGSTMGEVRETLGY